ncbi:hypothetical protein WKW79_29015 [Variovorax robiniae]|uniref:DNA helicase n=1 Tax=Variovorax robiniae TaxID=1836199 RepID=A0ABU8XFY0_9BURK
MRLPKLRQFTEAQKQVYLYAPTDKHVLVSGPPGTGKTLIACQRAIELEKREVPVMLGMFNRVLARYSSNAADGSRIPSATVLTWFGDWWKRSSGLPPHPEGTNRIAIEVPYEQKDAAKLAGAGWYANEWRPWEKKKGVWMMDVPTYLANPEAFSAWKVWHEPPRAQDNPSSLDWDAVAKHVLMYEECIPDKALELGTLLIDEGQDFPRGFYKTLRTLSAVALARGARVQHPPRCFVLADENQQITTSNSTLDEIAGALGIAADNRYQLLDNFRNTREIAELARSFFADVGVMPNLPARQGERPMLSVVANQAQVAQRISIWLTNNPGKEVGVLVFGEATRKMMATLLKDILSHQVGRPIRVQSYSWESRRDNPADKLQFDAPDVVTVLNMQSCKGLEFDATFIVDVSQAQIGIYGPDRFRMQMFVATSRARNWVQLIDSGPHAGAGPCFALMPGSDVLEREAAFAVSAATAPIAPPPAATGSKAPVVAELGEAAWVAQLQRIATRMSLQFDDHRAGGGALWIGGGPELRPLLGPLGLTYSEKRSAWWRKQ